MKKHFLMLKQHKVTGLKYLCYHKGTKESCYTYPGSGTYWKRHLKVHGKRISTIILLETDDKYIIMEEGLKYSDLWNVVDSKEYANLVREDGSGGHEAMATPEIIAKRAATLKSRIKSEGFTKGELSRAQRTSKRQKDVSMKDRCGENFVDPRKGKTGKEIYGEDFHAWNKGKNMKDVYGDDYIDPKSKPFKVISHLGERIYNSESDFILREKLAGPTFSKLKSTGSYKVKRQRNTRHPYKHGETITLEFI